MEDLADRATTYIANHEVVRRMACRWMEDRRTTAISMLNEIEVSIHHLKMRVMY